MLKKKTWILLVGARLNDVNKIIPSDILFYKKKR